MNRTKPYGAAVPKPFDFRIACEVGLSVTSPAAGMKDRQVTGNPVREIAEAKLELIGWSG
jgi:hypothetical protein